MLVNGSYSNLKLTLAEGIKCHSDLLCEFFCEGIQRDKLVGAEVMGLLPVVLGSVGLFLFGPDVLFCQGDELTELIAG